jgi:hypothetical protein
VPNTASLGMNFRGTAWRDGEPVVRVALPDGSLAEAMAAIGYMWDGGQFVKMTGSASGGLDVNVKNATLTVTGPISVTQGSSPWVSNDPGLPDTLGQKNMAGSTGVVIASDQTAVPISGNVGISGSVQVTQGTSPWIGSGNFGRTWTLAGSTDSVSLTDASGNALAVSGSTGRPRLEVVLPHEKEELQDIVESLKKIAAILVAGLGVDSFDYLVED